MVGIVIPIHCEGGPGTLGSSSNPRYDAKCIKNRKGSDAVARKPMLKKNSRQKLRTYNIQIQLEASKDDKSKNVPKVTTQTTTPLVNRKNAVSTKGSSKSVSVPSSKMLPRRISNKDLRGVTRRQSSKDLRSVLMKRQSSRDIVNGHGHKNVTKDPVINLIKRQSSQDFRLNRYTIRRDSINGLRIVSHDATDVDDDTEQDTLDRLSDIAISEESNEFSKFQLDALKTHNTYRSKHKVPNLKLDADLCKRAKEYSDFLAKTDTFEHSGDADFGENLYWSWSSDPRWKLEGVEPVKSWYDECQGYDYSREPVSLDTGHFTQLVWSDTTHLGVGVTQSKKTGKFYVVMKYSSPGNIIGSYRHHVKPPI